MPKEESSACEAYAELMTNEWKAVIFGGVFEGLVYWVIMKCRAMADVVVDGTKNRPLRRFLFWIMLLKQRFGEYDCDRKDG